MCSEGRGSDTLEHDPHTTRAVDTNERHVHEVNPRVSASIRSIQGERLALPAGLKMSPSRAFLPRSPKLKNDAAARAPGLEMIRLVVPRGAVNNVHTQPQKPMMTYQVCVWEEYRGRRLG